MNPETIWQAFSETGDPGYYLLYKAAEQGQSGDKGRDADREGDGARGQEPRAEA